MNTAKIIPQDLSEIGVIGLPDIPGLTTQQMQQKFEETAREVIIPRFNSLIDDVSEIETSQSGIESAIEGLEGEIEELDGKIEGVSEADAVTRNMIALDFSEFASYSIGSVVKRNGVLYRCVSDISVPGAWDSSKWIATKVSNELEKKAEMPVNTYNVSSSLWTTNTDVSTAGRFPYIAQINTTDFDGVTPPFWQMNGAGTLPTETEQEAIQKIQEAVFGADKVILYATDTVDVNLKLTTIGGRSVYTVIVPDYGTERDPAINGQPGIRPT